MIIWSRANNNYKNLYKRLFRFRIHYLDVMQIYLKIFSLEVVQGFLSSDKFRFSLEVVQCFIERKIY